MIFMIWYKYIHNKNIYIYLDKQDKQENPPSMERTNGSIFQHALFDFPDPDAPWCWYIKTYKSGWFLG